MKHCIHYSIFFLESDVPELDAPIPPVISNNATTKGGGLKLRTNLQSCETDTKKEDHIEDVIKKEEHIEDLIKKEEDHMEEEFTVIEEVISDSDDVQEVRVFYVCYISSHSSKIIFRIEVTETKAYL